MAETIGSLIDKICIAELKIFHLQEQIDRPDAAENHRRLCRGRLAIMRQQRDDLVSEIRALAVAWLRGQWKPKVYRQFKMYNDPRFRTTSERQTTHPAPLPAVPPVRSRSTTPLPLKPGRGAGRQALPKKSG